LDANGRARLQPHAKLFGCGIAKSRIFAQCIEPPYYRRFRTGMEIVITAEISQLKGRDIDISFADYFVTTRGEKEIEKQERGEKNRNYHAARCVSLE
jgi:HSP20 family molecular chaperone IbpA